MLLILHEKKSFIGIELSDPVFFTLTYQSITKNSAIEKYKNKIF